MMDSQKFLFDLPEDITYLNCAYMSPIPKSVAVVGTREIHRKLRPFQYGVEDFFQPMEDVKRLFARLIGTHEHERIALQPSVSYGVANVVNSLPIEKGTNIVVPGGQFPSNIYSWKRWAVEHGVELKFIEPVQKSKNPGKQWNEHLLDAIDQHTVAVAMSQVHWAWGTIFDLEAIRDRSREVGALLIVDATQSLGAYPMDQSILQADVILSAVYKWLMGPYGMALAYYGPYFDNGIPIEENWIAREGSDNFAGLVEYEDAYRPGAWRFSTGESSNFVHVAMVREALQQIEDWGVPRIHEHCELIAQDALKELTALGCELEHPDYRTAHLFSVGLPDQANIQELRSILEQAQVHISWRGERIRVSPHLYNDVADLERLVECIRQSVRS